MEATTALRQLGGVGRWHQLRERGCSSRSIDTAAALGAIERPARGLYALPGADPHLVTAVALGGRMTCVGAAAFHGLSVLTGATRPHVRVPRNRSAGAPGTVVHRHGGGDGIVVTVVEAVRDCVGCIPLLDAVVVVDSALNSGRVEFADLAPSATGHGVVRSRGVLSLADARAESPLETIIRVGLWQAGVEKVVPQVWISGVGRVDLLVDGWLVVEADGFAFHSDRAQYRHDRRRAAALAEQGYVLLRYCYEDIVHRWPVVLAQILRVLACGPRAQRHS